MTVEYLSLPGSTDDRTVVPVDLRFATAPSTAASRLTSYGFTVTRADNTATRVNEQGLIEVVPANTPRFDYDPVTLECKGLLIEEARENCVLYSSVPASMDVFALSGTVTDNGAVAGTGPDGSTTVRQFTFGAGGAARFRSSYMDGVAGTSYTGSVYIRTADGSTKTGSLDMSDGNNTPITVTGEWQRFSVTFAHPSMPYKFLDFNASEAAVLQFACPQIETGAFPTSYIPTTSAAVTRNTDVVECSDISGFYNVAEGSVVVEFDRTGFGSSFAWLFAFDNGPGVITDQLGIYIWDGGPTKRPTLKVTAGGSSSAEHAVSSSAVVLNAPTRVGVAWAENSFAGSTDGASAVEDSSGTVPSVTRLRLGTGDDYTNGHLRRFTYFAKRLLNATLVSLSGSGPTVVSTTPATTRTPKTPGLPEIPKDTPPGLRKLLEKMREMLETRNAQRGSPLDANPTFRDLINAGLVEVDPNAVLTAAGREFTVNTGNWLTSRVPAWVTDNTNPPTPTGLDVLANQTVIVLTWDDPNFANYKQTIVYRATSNNLSDAEVIGSTTGVTYVDELPPIGTTYFYWIRHESLSQLKSDFNDVNGTSVTNAPTAPTVSYTFDQDQLVVSWTTPTSNLAIQYYIVSYGSAAGQFAVGVSQSNAIRILADFSGSRTYWVQGVDINGSVGSAGSVVVTVTAPVAPVVTAGVTGGSLGLAFESTGGSLPVVSYEVRYGSDFASGTSLGSVTGTRLEYVINWTGSRTFWVVATDSAGNVSSAGQYVFTPTAPSVSGLTAQVIDNNVLLRWSGTAGTLPIRHYIVERDGNEVGTVGGLFSVLFESAAGSYTYSVTAVDTAGNEGAAASTTAVVSQPPDFVLFDQQDSDFGGTKTTAFYDADTDALYVNVDPEETWEEHFTSRGWTTIQDQIDAGYENYLVGKTSGSYVETVDYGTTLASTKITMSPTTYYSVGSMTMTPTLETSPDGSTYTKLGDVWSAYGTSFRYVRYSIAFSAAAAGSGLVDDTTVLLGIKPLTYTLDLKLKTAQGTVMCNSADASGTVVDISDWNFVDVQAIVVTPLSTAARIATYDFVDAPNPTEFKAFLWDTSGVRQSGNASWTVRGV